MSKKILIFGDSIAHGHYDLIRGGWVERLKIYFWKKELKDERFDFCVYNLGVSGDNSNNLIRRFDFECKTREPEIIIIAIGANDAQYIITNKTIRVPLDKFQSNLLALLKISKRYTNKIIFINSIKVDEKRVTPIPWDENKEKYYYNSNIEKYNELLNKFCVKYKLLLIEIYNLLSKEDLADGLHPNAHGHEKIFQRVKEFLLKNKVI